MVIWIGLIRTTIPFVRLHPNWAGCCYPELLSSSGTISAGGTSTPQYNTIMNLMFYLSPKATKEGEKLQLGVLDYHDTS